MDLSKVVLPTFILEPRSFLDKLSDSYYHSDILSKAVLEKDALIRMKIVTQWYLSGLYKKPKGLKKPYNPILGETFRCYWQHPNGSRTFYLAEQVSHHPPVSAFFIINRQDGFTINGSITAKSKFYGDSTSAILDGTAMLTLIPHNENYSLTVPYVHCRGLMMGSLTMELGGKVSITCEETKCQTEIEFKLRPLFGGWQNINSISGRLSHNKKAYATISGYWDGEIKIKDKHNQEEVLFNPTPEVKAQRLKRYTIQLENQDNFESEKLWKNVTTAIHDDNQVLATEEKSILEEAQRQKRLSINSTNGEWGHKYFQMDLETGRWNYIHADVRPWDPSTDIMQYEMDYIIFTSNKNKIKSIAQKN